MKSNTINFIKRAKWAYIAASAVMILLGAVIIIRPEISLITLCYITGSVITLFGIAKIVGYFAKDQYRLAFQFDFSLGIFSVLIGALILLHPLNIAVILPVITGVFVLIDGVFKMQTALDARRFGIKTWWLILLLAALTALCGLFLVIDPFGGATALMVLLGVTLIVDGVQNIYVVAYTVRAAKCMRECLEEDAYYEE